MTEHSEPISIKLRAEHGCWCKGHSPISNHLIDQYIHNYNDKDSRSQYLHHETGPEIIAWLALGTAGLTATKALIDLVTAVIKAAQKGQKEQDDQRGKLLLIVRDTFKTESSTEEIVLEIYENDLISPEQVKKAIDSGIRKRSKRR